MGKEIRLLIGRHTWFAIGLKTNSIPSPLDYDQCQWSPQKTDWLRYNSGNSWNYYYRSRCTFGAQQQKKGTPTMILATQQEICFIFCCEKCQTCFLLSLMEFLNRFLLPYTWAYSHLRWKVHLVMQIADF